MLLHFDKNKRNAEKNALLQIALQKTWVERLVYLVALGYMKPVIIYMRQEGKTLDKGTVAHFMQNVSRNCGS